MTNYISFKYNIINHIKDKDFQQHINKYLKLNAKIIFLDYKNVNHNNLN